MGPVCILAAGMCNSYVFVQILAPFSGRWFSIKRVTSTHSTLRLHSPRTADFYNERSNLCGGERAERGLERVNNETNVNCRYFVRKLLQISVILIFRNITTTSRYIETAVKFNWFIATESFCHFQFDN